jgi:hypothetical protein
MFLSFQPTAAKVGKHSKTILQASHLPIHPSLTRILQLQVKSQSMLHSCGSVLLCGNGTIRLPNNSTVEVNSAQSAIVSLTPSVIAQELLTKEDGCENASETIY